MILLLAVLLSSFGKPAVTSAQTWTNNGPEGGEILALAIEPASNSTLYAGTSGGGVFKSTNAGQSWNATGLRNASVHALAAPGPTVLYAGPRVKVSPRAPMAESHGPLSMLASPASSVSTPL